MHKAGGVAARPRQTVDKAGADRIGNGYEHNWHGARCLQQRRHVRGAESQDDIGSKGDQFRRELPSLVGITRGPAIVDLHVSAVDPTQLLQRLQKRSRVGLRARVVRVAGALKHTDTPHPLALLRARGERRDRHRAAGKSYEIAPPQDRVPRWTRS